MKYGLAEDDMEKIQAVFATHPNVKQVVIFGSRAKGNFKNGSDIDLAVKGDALTFDDILEIHAQLENIGLLYKFDLQLFSSIKDPDVLAHISRVGSVFYPPI